MGTNSRAILSASLFWAATGLTGYGWPAYGSSERAGQTGLQLAEAVKASIGKWTERMGPRVASHPIPNRRPVGPAP